MSAFYDLLRVPRHHNAQSARRIRWFGLACQALPDHIMDAPAHPGSNVTNRDLVEAITGSLCGYPDDHIRDSTYMPCHITSLEAALMASTLESFGQQLFLPHRIFMSSWVSYLNEWQALVRDIQTSSLFAWSQNVSYWPSLLMQVNERAIKRVHWEAREYWREYQGEYKPLPWGAEQGILPIPGHFAHVSKEDPSMIAFTENENKGIRDIQTRIRPGRYLKRFYPELPDERISELQAEMTGAHRLCFAKTPDEIEKVYLEGPSSCMAHSPSSYAGHCHPVRVYGDSDLQVAYMVLEGTKKIKARCLVWPEKKKHGRMYGDHERLSKMLRDLGYTGDSGYALTGARFRRITDKNGDGDRLIMPYIDGPQSFDVLDKEWCRIGGSLNACWTNGTDHEETEDGHYCECCEDTYSEDSMRTVYVRRHSTVAWCYHCTDDNAYYVESLDEYVDSEQTIEVITEYRTSGRHITERFADWQEEWYYCDGLQEFVHDDIEPVHMESGETWCRPYFDENGIEVDGKYYARGEEPQPEEATEEAEAA